MSDIVHTCYVSDGDESPVHTNNLPQCNANCQNIDVSNIKILDQNDKHRFKNDISSTSYINELSPTSLYENMTIDDTDLNSEDNYIFYSDEDEFFMELNDSSADEYKSQRSINLLQSSDEKCTIDAKIQESTDIIDDQIGNKTFADAQIGNEPYADHTEMYDVAVSDFYQDIKDTHTEIEPITLEDAEQYICENDIKTDHSFQGKVLNIIIYIISYILIFIYNVLSHTFIYVLSHKFYVI